MTRKEILDKAKHAITTSKNHTYGEPEDSFSAIAQLWNAWLGLRFPGKTFDLTPSDVCEMMIEFKIARIRSGGDPTDDTLADIAGYAACIADMDKGEDKPIKAIKAKMNCERCDHRLRIGLGSYLCALDECVYGNHNA